jgi:hypothetical protein
VECALDERQVRERVWAWRTWAAAAASLVLAVALGGYAWLGRGAHEPIQQAALPPPQQEQMSAAVELLEPEAADVVSFRVGEVQVVMIFDERLAL